MAPPTLQLQASTAGPIQRTQSDTSAVVNYIHGEMTTNAGGSDVAYIKNQFAIARALGWIPGGAIAGLINIYNAYKRWYDLVKTGGIWDHKSAIRSAYGDWSMDSSTNTEYFYDIWSNVHYGYIGKACGFPDWDLLAGAGAAQVMAGTVPDGYWRRRFEELGDADFLAAFDDPKDQAAIRLGMRLWGSGGAGVSSSQILTAARADAGNLSTR